MISKFPFFVIDIKVW